MIGAFGRFKHVAFLNRQTCLQGDRHKRFQVFFVEGNCLLDRVQLNDTNDFFFAVDQRGAHDRANAKINNALRHIKSIVRRSVAAEHRSFGFDDLVDDRSAHSDLFIVGCMSSFQSDGLEVAVFIFKDDKATVCLDI